MTGIIWTNNIKAGNKKLEQMVENYKRIGVNTISYMNSKHGSTATFDNEDCWEVVKPSYAHRACRCNIAYIDRTIDKKVINEIIFPAIIEYPYSAYKYITLSPEIEEN